MATVSLSVVDSTARHWTTSFLLVIDKPSCVSTAHRDAQQNTQSYENSICQSASRVSPGADRAFCSYPPEWLLWDADLPQARLSDATRTVSNKVANSTFLRFDIHNHQPVLPGQQTHTLTSLKLFEVLRRFAGHCITNPSSSPLATIWRVSVTRSNSQLSWADHHRSSTTFNILKSRIACGWSCSKDLGRLLQRKKVFAIFSPVSIQNWGACTSRFTSFGPYSQSNFSTLFLWHLLCPPPSPLLPKATISLSHDASPLFFSVMLIKVLPCRGFPRILAGPRQIGEGPAALSYESAHKSQESGTESLERSPVPTYESRSEAHLQVAVRPPMYYKS